MEILELKIITKITSLLKGLNTKLGRLVKGRINKFEDRSTELSNLKNQETNMRKKINKASVCETVSSD